MGVKTDIEWADSTINFMMGCDGCELYNRLNKERGKLDRCYAFYLTKRYAGRKGWPDSFDDPATFIERLDQIERWKDLTGSKRPSKPWLNELPRHIFHGDMGDYWTESLQVDWLAPHIDRLGDMPHTHMFLTKRPRRMAKMFAQVGYVPENFMLGTSVTSKATLARAAELIGGIGSLTNRLFLSVEPLVESVTEPGRMCLQKLFMLDYDFSQTVVIVGGESGYKARPFDLEWASEIKDVCDQANVAFFMKQTGSNPVYRGRPYAVEGKGHKITELPTHLRVRMMNYERDWMQMTRSLGGIRR